MLYMPDGGIREDFPHVAETVDAGIKAGEIRPMLVVGIDDVGPETERLAEALRADAPAGLKWRYKPRPDLRHDNIYRSAAPQILRELF